jgi:flagellar motor switch protein FliG
MATDVRKAAVLLASLPEEEAAQLLSKLQPKQVELVSIEIARLGHIGGDEQSQAIREFADVNPQSFGTSTGGLDLAKTLVEKALGKNANSTLENVRQQIEALPFAFVQKIDATHLLTFIMDEHPQTIALILSHLQPQKAAQVIAGLPSDRQLSVVRRIARMGQTNPEIIQEVEKGLEHRMSSISGQSYETAGGVESVAEILNVTDRATERGLLENLAQEDPDLVEEIRRRMFVFDDISKFQTKDIQTVLKNVESSQWALALKTASDDLKQKILGNMSSRAAEMLKEEMDYLGPVKRSAVEQMQQQIVDIVRRLEDAGEITVAAGEEVEEMV